MTLCPLPTLQPLISRNYRGDVEMSMIDKFLPMVLDAEEEGSQSPILIHEKVTFVYIKHQNLYRILGCGERGKGRREGGGKGGRGGAHFYLHTLGVWGGPLGARINETL